MLLVEILTSIVMPIFILIGLGYLLDHQFNLDVRTLSRISFYIISPALLFSIAYESTLSLHEISSIGAFILAHLSIMFMLALSVFSLPAFRENRPVLILGTLFTNSGNYGVPLMLLTFGDAADKAMGAIGIVLTLQSLLFFSAGLVMLVGARDGNLKSTLLQVLRYPVLAGIVLGFLMRGLHIGLPVPIQGVLTSIKGAYVALALITLGVQLSKCPMQGDAFPISALAALRFIASPLLAMLLVPLFGFDPTISATLILAAALPTAVNVFIVASEVNRSVDLASRIVFWTTLASAVVIPIVILLIH
jgi:malate permease and related proteins